MRSPFRQRAAGWCKVVGKCAEIPPGVACLNISRGGRVRPKEREALMDAVRVFSRENAELEVVPRFLRPLSCMG